jgi:GAF domain-containing protein
MSEGVAVSAVADTGRQAQINTAFVTLADSLVDQYDTLDLLDRLVGFCTELLAAEAAGIVLGDARRELRAVAASDDAAHVMELLQLQSDEGPCLDCVRSGEPVSVPDLAAQAPQWPRFVAAAMHQGPYRSVHALPLRLRGSAIGALNLFHREPGPLPPADLALAQALADVATIGILQERALRRAEVLTEQLQSALNSRVVVEQAKGVLAASAGVDMDVAFRALRDHARSRNLRLTDVARRVVARDLDAGDVLGSA